MSRVFPKKYDLVRTNSLCPPTEEILLESVKRNDIEKIRRLVSDNRDILSFIYKDSHKPILLIACTEDYVKSETVETLIEEGADLYYTSEEDEDWQALHFVASSTNSVKLKVIVDNLQPGRINDLAKGSNGLHVLLTYGDSDDEEEFIKCAQILIGAGIDLNQGDANNISPILWAAKKGFREIVSAILDNGVICVDIDSHTSRGKTARELIKEKGLYDKTLPQPCQTENNNDDPVKVLFSYLKQSKENAFINFNEGKIQQYADQVDGNSTLLQYCCQKGFLKCVRHLLNNGANPNKTAARNSEKPIEIAAEFGFFEIFKLLLDNPHVQIPSRVLSFLVRKYNDNVTYSLKNDESDKYVTIDHKKCYEVLIDKLAQNKALIDINEQDERSNSPLHYAIRYSDPERSHELLGLGASLASKNTFGIMPVEDIEPEVLEKHLDNCIEFDRDSKKFDKEDFTVTFNYRTLVPPQKLPCKNNMTLEISDVESDVNSDDQDLTAEMEVISYMSKAVEFKHLLKHPVIVSFLFMKWHRIQWLFRINLLFYLIFATSLIVYIFTYFANFTEYKDKSSFVVVLIHISFVLLCITYIKLVLRELFQMIACFGKYFTSFENYIEIILIAITGFIIFEGSPSNDTRKQLSALAILLVAFELILMVGQHPLLSTNVVMLKTVSYNFFKFLLWYSVLIVAFALSFYILFTDPSPDENSQNATKNNQQGGNGEEAEENYFENPGKSVFKTIVMLTGEFDASDLNFHTYPIISKLIFIMFVFMIAIILLNLLTGLAVSDTQMIKNDAELVGHIARAQHIKYVETMLLGNILPVSVMRTIQDLCCCLQFRSDLRYVFKPLAKRACIFPDVLNYELTIYPNKKGQILLYNACNRRKVESQKCSCGFSDIHLDKETIRRTNNIIRAKREELSNENETRLKKAREINMKKLEEQIDYLQREQTNINEKLDIIINYIYEKSITS